MDGAWLRRLVDGEWQRLGPALVVIAGLRQWVPALAGPGCFGEEPTIVGTLGRPSAYTLEPISEMQCRTGSCGDIVCCPDDA